MVVRPPYLPDHPLVAVLAKEKYRDYSLGVEPDVWRVG
jgi:hypothetical protein